MTDDARDGVDRVAPLPDGEGEGPWAEAACLFESARWARLLADVYGFEFYAAVGPEGDVIRYACVEGVLGPRLVSLPFGDYTDTSATPPAAYAALARAVRARYAKAPAVFKTTYGPDVAGPGRVVRTAFVHRVATAEGGVAEAYRSAFARGIRKARREGVEVVRAADAEAMETFYDLYRRLRFEKFGSLPQPVRFFDHLRRRYIDGRRGFVLLARRAGRAVAGAVVLRHRDVLYYKYGASAAEALPHRPNNLLFHALLEGAAAEGVGTVDLGLSGAGPGYAGLVRFKEAMGGRGAPITYYRLDPPGYDPGPEKALKALLGRVSGAVAAREPETAEADVFSEILYPHFA